MATVASSIAPAVATDAIAAGIAAEVLCLGRCGAVSRQAADRQATLRKFDRPEVCLPSHYIERYGFGSGPPPRATHSGATCGQRKCPDLVGGTTFTARRKDLSPQEMVAAGRGEGRGAATAATPEPGISKVMVAGGKPCFAAAYRRSSTGTQPLGRSVSPSL